MSTSLYDTFGNDVSYEIRGGILSAYLKDSTVEFPLPEAASELLSDLSDPPQTFNSTILAMVTSKLEKIGFKKANANALAPVLLTVAKQLNVDPLDFFSNTEASLDLTTDAYDAINNRRPAGSIVSLALPTLNSKSKISALIKP
jgi:hypothetical protein